MTERNGNDVTRSDLKSPNTINTNVISNFRHPIPQNKKDRRKVERKKLSISSEVPCFTFDEEDERLCSQRQKDSISQCVGDRKFSNFSANTISDSDSDDFETCYSGRRNTKLYINSQVGSDEQREYEAACKYCGVQVIQQLSNCLNSDSVHLKGAVLTTGDTKACAIALLSNRLVECIHLESNGLGASARYFGDIMRKNAFVTELRITDNELGHEGAKSICDALIHNNTCLILDLSGNNFSDSDAEHFEKLLQENNTITRLYLRHNIFGERGGELLASGIEGNDCLRELDLSWNHLRMNGAAAIGDALLQNNRLEELNVAWNGFNISGAKHIGEALAENTTLIKLDLSNNRITRVCIPFLIKGLGNNRTLQTLKLEMNPLTADGAFSMLKHLSEDVTSPINYLDFGDQAVEDEFEELLHDMKKNREIKVVYGHISKSLRIGFSKTGTAASSGDFEHKLPEIKGEPILVLMEFMRLQNYRLIDLFKSLDVDGDASLTRQEFESGLRNANIPLSDKSMKELVKRLDKDGDGVVDYGELVKGQREHKIRMMELMKSDIPFEHSEIGEISRKIKQMMKQQLVARLE